MALPANAFERFAVFYVEIQVGRGMDVDVFSCVVDAKPHYYRQCLHWLATLLASGSATPDMLCVHTLGGIPAAFEALLGRLGVRRIPIAAFPSPDSPYCNKLMQLKSRALAEYDTIVLLDTDMAFAADIRPILRETRLAAKIVDTSSPPLTLLDRLLRASGLSRKPTCIPSDFGRGETYAGNCNGGLYAFSREALRELAPYWLKWAYWTLEQKRLLGDYIKHTDQIGFCFALLETGMSVEQLDITMNFPTHLKPATYAGRQFEKPSVLHYHGNTDPSGLLRPIGLPAVDAAIATVNAAIEDFDACLSELLHDIRL